MWEASRIGLFVDFNGNKNIVMSDGNVKEYPIGGMICEYARLRPTEIKETIMSLPLFQEQSLADKGGEALLWFYHALLEKHGMVTATMIVTDFTNYLQDFNLANNEEKKMLLADCNKDKDTDKVKQFILEDTEYDEFGLETVGQAFLSAYCSYAYSFVTFKYSFDMLVSGDEFDEDKIMAFWDLYTENTDLQHIDYKIMFFDSTFHSMYTIQTSLSLILFEAAHVLDANTKFVKCKNCGNYFVPIGRSDAIYCGYPSPQDKSKDCRDIGAQATRARKMKNDTVTQEYRRLYMRLKMSIKRHPESQSLKEQLIALTKGMKEYRKLIQDGEASPDDVLEWLSALDE